MVKNRNVPLNSPEYYFRFLGLDTKFEEFVISKLGSPTDIIVLEQGVIDNEEGLNRRVNLLYRLSESSCPEKFRICMDEIVNNPNTLVDVLFSLVMDKNHGVFIFPRYVSTFIHHTRAELMISYTYY